MNRKLSVSLKDLSLDEIEDLLLRAEKVAKTFILSQIPPKELKTYNIVIEFDSDEIKIDCIIDIELVKHSKLNPKEITEKTVELVFKTIDTELEKIS